MREGRSDAPADPARRGPQAASTHLAAVDLTCASPIVGIARAYSSSLQRRNAKGRVGGVFSLMIPIKLCAHGDEQDAVVVQIASVHSTFDFHRHILPARAAQLQRERV